VDRLSARARRLCAPPRASSRPYCSGASAVARRVSGHDGGRELYGVVAANSRAHDSAARRARRHRPRPEAPPSQTIRSVRCRLRRCRVPRRRSAGPGVGRADVRGLRQARRHGDVPRPHGSHARARSRHGRARAVLHEAPLAGYLGGGYPTGALLPLGVGARLVDTDAAWVFQPYLAFLAAMLALCLYGLAGHVVPSRPWRAFVAALASQSALLYGFALWGGVKELYAAALLALVAASVLLVEKSGRSGLVPGAAAAATVLALSPGALVWLPPMLVALLAAARAKPRGVAVACAAGAGLALPRSCPQAISCGQATGRSSVTPTSSAISWAHSTGAAPRHLADGRLSHRSQRHGDYPARARCRACCGGNRAPRPAGTARERPACLCGFVRARRCRVLRSRLTLGRGQGVRGCVAGRSASRARRRHEAPGR
jgi:hypothetical protein